MKTIETSLVAVTCSAVAALLAGSVAVSTYDTMLEQPQVSAGSVSIAELAPGEVEEQVPVKEAEAPLDSPATEQQQRAAEAEAPPVEVPSDVVVPSAEAPADVEQPSVEP